LTYRRDNPWPAQSADTSLWTVGRFTGIADAIGIGLPAEEMRTDPNSLDRLLELSRSQEGRARQLACRNLCTCHVRADDNRVWTRLLELVEDPSPRVRADVIHAMTDSTPATRVLAVIQALESRRNDPDERIRRRVRKTLAHYRRTGKLTDAAR
jgi:hypothetical protein